MEGAEMPEMSDATAAAIGRIHANSRKGWLEACDGMDDDPPQGKEHFNWFKCPHVPGHKCEKGENSRCPECEVFQDAVARGEIVKVDVEVAKEREKQRKEWEKFWGQHVKDVRIERAERRRKRLGLPPGCDRED